MKISKFRKYISWNLISIIGYFGAVIAIMFYLIVAVASSGTTIRPDINEIFYKHIINNIVTPYLQFYRFQVFLIFLCLVLSVFEHKHNKNSENFGVRWFSNHEKLYTSMFVIGLSLNLLPLYIFLAILISWLIKLT